LVDQVKAYTSLTPFSCSTTRVGTWPNPKTMDNVVKALLRQSLYLT
jgi:hypothetical protein